MTKPMLKPVPQEPPPIDILQVARTTPIRLPNAAYRSREYLTPTEMDALLEAARKMRHGHRDSTMLLIAYRHGFRAAEICDLRWDQIDLDQARLHVKRVKRGMPSVHPIQGDELRALRRLKRESAAHSDFVFVSERKAPFSTAGFARLVERAGKEAGLPFKAHPTCFATRPATSSPTTVSIPALSSTTWAPQHSAYGPLQRAQRDPL